MDISQCLRNLVLLRSAKYITLSQAGFTRVHQHHISEIKGRVFELKAGLESVALAGRVLGGLGAGIAVGVAAHGWSTTKPMQILSCTNIIRSLKKVDPISIT